MNDTPHNLHTHLEIFADDIYAFAANKNKWYSISAITKQLKLISTCFAKWNMLINVNKTEPILFSRLRQESRDKYKITLNNNELLWSDHYKYLGVILDQGIICLYVMLACCIIY